MKHTIWILTFFTLITNSSFAFQSNPAAMNCLKLNGKLELDHHSSGEYSVCIIDEWKLYYEMQERNLIITHQYDQISTPNPAAVNCDDIGGEIRMASNENGQYGACAIEAWKLYGIINVIP